jgi:hypothetical protein
MEETRHYFNIELNQKDAEKLQKYLYDSGIHFEISGSFELVHFEINLNSDEFNQVVKWIEFNIFYNTINEQKRG